MPVNIVISVNIRNRKTYFFSELGLTKAASIKACFIGTGATLEKSYHMTFPIIFGTQTSCKISDNNSFYWKVARTLRDIVIIICYIFGQLFFMPCGVTCQAWSKEVPINDGTWRFRYSLYNVCIEVYREIFCGSYEFSRYFL